MGEAAGTPVVASGLCAVLRDAPDLPGRLRGADGTALSTGALLEAAGRVGERAGDVAGRVIGLRAENGPSWVTGLLGLLEAGAHPLLVGADAPGAEADRLLGDAGGEGWLDPATGAVSPARGTSSARNAVAGESTLVLATSGSTGRPSLVRRTESDLVAEGLRYRDGVGVGPDDRVLIPLPLSHSYALGWLFGALLSGSAVVPVPPTALGATADELAGGATVVVLTPSLARLSALRTVRRGGPRAPRLRMAMVGAGPVDAGLERAVRDALGVPTSRNYGSTETGALCAGVADPDGPGLEPGCVGRVLPGVVHEIVGGPGDAASPSTGLLRVRTAPGADWHDTGDLVTETADGLRVLGRRASAVRRGDRWVAPLEVEAVLRAHPGVRDAHVTGRPGRHAGADRLVADVVLAEGTGVEDLRRHLAGQLSPAKRPDELRAREDLGRTATGKVPAPARPRLTAAGLAATRAHKASELLFALREVGVLERLDGDHDVVDLALRTGCRVDALTRLLDIAADLGLVTADPHGDDAGVAPEEALGFVDLEASLSRGWTSREALAALARGDGRDGRPFERSAPDPGFARLYRRAMEAPSARARAVLGTRLLRVPRGARVLEVTAGPGRYLPSLIDADPEATGHLAAVGALAGEPHPALGGSARVEVSPDPGAGGFDVCVVVNAVHGPAPGDDLDWLLSRLRPGGRLLVDDVFLPEGGGPGSELALDWCTHGGTSWPRLRDLAEALTARGARVGRGVPLPGGAAALVPATVPRTTRTANEEER
ncbi:AMP-binding protein [Nocardiopsis sp. RV163]|uniref:AMP-binding protein n=1 Tax=Nocardiopsis sp. RV163 TaxID=1661388 RepID=UPI00064BBD85|nr:AMP-binding protein [Nocardiopsis sp. RV163]